jgi:hypothetical protein
MVRGAVVAVTFVAILMGAQSAGAGGTRPGVLYGDFLWAGFIDDLEELYKPAAGWALGYAQPVAEDWAVALEIGARYHGNRARHDEGPFVDPGIEDEAIRELGPADDFRMIPWTAQVRWNLPWTPWPGDADINVGAGIGGYSIRWEWNDPGEVVNQTFFGGNLGAQIAYHRTDAFDVTLGATYHIVSIDDFYSEEDLYHVVELRLGIGLHLSELGSRQ